MLIINKMFYNISGFAKQIFCCKARFYGYKMFHDRAYSLFSPTKIRLTFLIGIFSAFNFGSFSFFFTIKRGNIYMTDMCFLLNW